MKSKLAQINKMKFKNILHKLWNILSEKERLFDEVARSKAVELAEHELFETEHIFAILTFGVFVGLPAPPMQITLDLLPDCEKEIMLLMQKVDTAHEPLSVLASLFQVD